VTDRVDAGVQEPARKRQIPKGDLAALGSLALLFAAFYPAVLFFGHTITFRDLGFFFGPLREITFREISAGRFPSWNIHSLSGLPLFSDPNIALANPFTWLYPLGGVRLLALGTLAAIVLVSYSLLRRLDFSPLAALVGAAVYSYGGTTQSLIPLAPGLSCFLWVPAFLYSLHRSLESAAEDRPGRNRLAVATALLLAFLLVAGEPFLGVQGLAIGAILSITALARGGSNRAAKKRILAHLAVIGIIGLLLASFQIVPTLHQLARAPRGSGFRPEHGPLSWSLRPARLGSLVLPELFGDPFAESDADYWGSVFADKGGSYVPAIYTGLLPLALAVVASRKKLGRVLFVVMGVCALLSFGKYTPIGPALLRLCPPLSALRYPEKWLFPFHLALALAAAIGFRELTGSVTGTSTAGDDGADRRFRNALAALFMVLAVPLFLTAALPKTAAGLLVSARVAPESLASHAVEVLRGQSATMWVLAGAYFGLSFLLRTPERRRTALVLIAALFLADLVHWNSRLLPTAERNVFEKSDVVTDALRQAAGGAPVYQDSEWNGARARAAAFDAGGYDPAQPLLGVFHGLRYAANNEVDRMGPRTSIAYAGITSNTPWNSIKVGRIQRAGIGAVATLQDLDGVAGLGRVHFDGWETFARRIYRLDRTRPETMLAARTFFAQNAEDMERLLAFPDVDPVTDTVAVDSGAPPGQRIWNPGTILRSELVSPVEERFEVESRAGAFLVRARSFDPDFIARIDGAAAPTLLTDGMFTGLPIPPGRHEIRFRYENRSIRKGALLSILGILAAFIFFLAPPGRRLQEGV